jgi:hypothetical protein
MIKKGFFRGALSRYKESQPKSGAVAVASQNFTRNEQVSQPVTQATPATNDQTLSAARRNGRYGSRSGVFGRYR